MIDVVTMKFGPKYPSEWANRLARAVQRNCSLPYRCVCFTDDPVGLSPDIYVVEQPDLGGWWNHLYAFSGWTARRQLLIDVDDVVVGSLDDLARYDGPHELNSDVYCPGNVDGGCQLIPAGVTTTLFDDFVRDPQAIKRACYSDKQFYIARINDSPRIQDLFPGQWVSYKVHCQGKSLPENARIVGFHGDPKPDAVTDPWVKEHWQ
jgi:hypothetical protein